MLGGAAAWPFAARAQQREQMRRIGVFVAPGREQETTLLFAGALAKLGWVEGRNVHIDYRTYSSNPENLRAVAAELIAPHPDVIFAAGVSFVVVREQTQTIPIVFTQVSAPVERGFVASLARPGGNVTGFAQFPPSLASKWLGLLKEVAPKTCPLGDDIRSRCSAPCTALLAFRRSGVAHHGYGSDRCPSSHRQRDRNRHNLARARRRRRPSRDPGHFHPRASTSDNPIRRGASCASNISITGLCQ